MSFEEAWSIVKTVPVSPWERCLLADGPEECPNRRMKNSGLGLCASCYNGALDYEKKNRDPNDNAPRGEIEYAKEEKDFVEEVRDLVEQGMDVMSAVRNVARLLDLDGRNLMRAYTEAYR